LSVPVIATVPTAHLKVDHPEDEMAARDVILLVHPLCQVATLSGHVPGGNLLTLFGEGVNRMSFRG
jgi:hypothetical protein